MSKTAKISIIAGVVILLIILLYFFGMKKPDNKDLTFVTDDWSETYDPHDKGPYGTYVMKELLDTVGLFGNFITLFDGLERDLQDHPKVNDIYFFVGPENHMPDSSALYLLEFVAAGNTAFISSHKYPGEMEYELFYNSYEILKDDRPFDSVQYLRFEHPDLMSKRYQFRYVYNNKPAKKYWESFDPDNFEMQDSIGPVVLGTSTKGDWNFVKIRYGEGYFFLHTIPYCFTNISMFKRDGFMYAENVLEHIPPGRVQWDKYNLKEHYSSSSGNASSKGGGERRQSMLQFIVEHPPLAWAMVILIIGALLYALFKGKRMQRIIPATELKENTSLEYINTLSSLYMQHGSHTKLIKLKEKTFMNFIAERYFIITNKPDDRYIEKVAVKSQVEKEKIAEIFDIFEQLNGAANVSDDDLILLHKKIEYFYKKCR